MNEPNSGKGSAAKEARAPFSSTNDYEDLPDSPLDEVQMKQEEVILDLPDVKDIPGQENIIPPKMNSFADTTISSDDEEGLNVFDDENEQVEENNEL